MEGNGGSVAELQYFRNYELVVVIPTYWWGNWHSLIFAPSSPPLSSVMFWFLDIHVAPVVASHHLRSSSRSQVWWAKVKDLRPYMCLRWWYFVFKGWSPLIVDQFSSFSLCSSQVRQSQGTKPLWSWTCKCRTWLEHKLEIEIWSLTILERFLIWRNQAAQIILCTNERCYFFTWAL